MQMERRQRQRPRNNERAPEIIIEMVLRPCENTDQFQALAPEAPGTASTGARLLDRSLAPVLTELNQLKSIIQSYIPTESATASAIVAHAFGSGGKRIRPALYYFSCQLIGYDGVHLHPIAAVAEFVHTASLLHDDVVDNSTLRRNKPTAQSIWGGEAAVLVGDLIYARASEMMAATGSRDLVSGFARAIRLMSEGELLQLENIFNTDTDEARYFRIIECKTATLIAMACRSAGLLGNVSEAKQEALADFGKNVGIAFQLIDDALDYTGLADVFGKRPLSDLHEGKVTLPLIIAAQQATAHEREKLLSALSSSDSLAENCEWVGEFVRKYRGDELTIERAASYTNAAIAALQIFPDGPARRQMEALANQLIMRQV